MPKNDEFENFSELRSDEINPESSNTGVLAEVHVAGRLTGLSPFISNVNFISRQHNKAAIDLSCILLDREHFNVQVKSSIHDSGRPLELEDVRRWLVQSTPVLLVEVRGLGRNAPQYFVDYLPEYAKCVHSGDTQIKFSTAQCRRVRLDDECQGARMACEAFISRAISMWRVLQSRPGGVIGAGGDTTWGKSLVSADFAKCALIREDALALVEIFLKPESPAHRNWAVSVILDSLRIEKASGSETEIRRLARKDARWREINQNLKSLRPKLELEKNRGLLDLVSGVDFVSQILEGAVTKTFERDGRVPISVLRFVEPILLGQNRGFTIEKLLALLEVASPPMVKICLLHAMRYCLASQNLGDRFMQRCLIKEHSKAISTELTGTEIEVCVLDSQFLRTRAMVGDGEASRIQKKLVKSEYGRRATSGLNQAMFYQSLASEKQDLELRANRMKAQGKEDLDFYNALLKGVSGGEKKILSPQEAKLYWQAFRKTG